LGRNKPGFLWNHYFVAFLQHFDLFTGLNGIIHCRYPLQAGHIVYLNPAQRSHVTTGYGAPEHRFVQETAPYQLFEQQYRAGIM
jgi:hypothetical protein